MTTLNFQLISVLGIFSAARAFVILKCALLSKEFAFRFADKLKAFSWLYVFLVCAFDIIGRTHLLVDSTANALALALISMAIAGIISDRKAQVESES